MIKLRTNLITFLIIINTVFITSCGAKKPNVELEKFNTESNSPPQGNLLQPSEQNSSKNERVAVGSFQTTLLDKDPDRVKNIRLAMDQINGYIIKSGEVFSFNQVVGKRKAEDGYEKAKIIVNKKSKEAIGGGICQLSSTLYNAAVKSNLEIIERHSHSKDVGYVTRGNDAAISYGTLDLKFKNNKDFPIKIETGMQNEKVSVTLWKE